MATLAPFAAPSGGETSEAATQAQIRLESPSYGSLWRNNNGACVDEKDRHIRYGLANDSKKINDVFKSSDLIGMTRMIIEPRHIGRTIGIFTACEVKRPNWKLQPSDKRGHAQQNFLNAVNASGGIGFFASSVRDYTNAIERYKK